MKLYIKVIVFLLFSVNTLAQLDKAYFKKLKTEKVKSSDLVEWKQFGPGMSGYCEEFWCHPTKEGVMYMSPDMHNTYGTWDDGKSWHTIKDCDGNGRDLRRTKSMDFSSQDENFGYAIDVRGALYLTKDLGTTWNLVDDFVSNGKYSQIVVDPSNDTNWYIGSGDFWNVKFNHRSQNSTLGNLSKYTNYGHILKSVDKGKTWGKITKGLPETLDVGRIIVDPTNSNNIIIASNSGIYRSTNKGESWMLSGNGLPNNLPRDLTYYYNKETNEFILYELEQTVYVENGKTISAKGGIYKSLDGGESWISISGDIAIDLTKIKNYSAKQGYWKTMAHWFGKTVEDIQKSHPDYPEKIFSTFNRIAVNPTDKNEIYISQNVKHDKAFGPGDVWKTNDGGKHWIATTRTGADWITGKDNAYWESRNNPIGANVKFAHLQRDVDERPEIAGNRFMKINSKGDVFICIEQQTLRSQDHGISWQQVDDDETFEGSGHWVGRGGSNLPGRFMLLDTGIKGRKFFCSGEHGLWELASLDAYPDKNAVAVKQIEGQLNHKGATSIASVAVHPKDPNIIYMLMFRQEHRGAFRKSTDGGKTWTDVSQPIKAGGNISNNILQGSLIVDYKTPSTIYFNTIDSPISEVSGPRAPFNGHGIYKSIDSGLTWTRINNGLPTVGNNKEAINVRRLAIDPDNPEILYAALVQSKDGKITGGLFKSKDKGETWEKERIPSDIVAVNNIFIDKQTKNMFISCGREKGTLEEGGVWKSEDQGKSWKKIFDMPYVWQTETSPLNSNIMTVNVALPDEKKGAVTINPGAYLSRDGGKSWIKINKNLGQPDTITDLKPDPEDENVLWCALKGSGWAKAIILPD